MPVALAVDLVNVHQVRDRDDVSIRFAPEATRVAQGCQSVRAFMFWAEFLQCLSDATP